MKIKRFVAQDMRQALRMVREALGEDAVILSNKTVDGGVELTAAIDLVAEESTETVDRRITEPRRPQRPATQRSGLDSVSVDALAANPENDAPKASYPSSLSPHSRFLALACSATEVAI